MLARLRGDGFACEALSGRSDYNISINADMTVSCNCNDQDGSGWIGDLDLDSFEEIFGGPTAQSFRAQLASARLPIGRCAVCRELRRLPRPEAEANASHFRIPRALMVENTSACNLACTSCSRTLVRDARRRPSLRMPEVERIAELIAKHDVELLHYFKLGEPFSSSRIGDELRLLRRRNPSLQIVLSTNGILLDSDAKRDAAMELDELIFSIDGVDTASVQRYQRGGDFPAAYRNLCEVVSHRDAERAQSPSTARDPQIGWRYVVFRWNDRDSQLEQAERLAREANADFFELVYANTPFNGISWRRFGSATHRRLGRGEHGWGKRTPLR